MNEVEVDSSKLQSAKNLATVVYALQALSLLIGISGIAAIIINYIKRDDVAGTWVAGHFRWQIRTFWFALLWAVIGWVTMWLFVGWIVWCAGYVWFIYRVVRGWLNLNDGKEMYAA
ncbi:hypothetical protein PIGHUM_01264 [Pigmentiphaga humi]|uniref:Transmembrane protein n=1 Tax=Pigmentiphaga humi TaxID=2478468 RepID=A0A3P4AYQ0_9BURK|nr:hypothetical protein [Pigmentiphaga humi]VCU69204.1 hypothetical protein PIGHUM_01264 [Pigmentiphaga humi]